MSHCARQVGEEDFKLFDYILAMDTSNLEDLQDIAEYLPEEQDKSKLGKGSTGVELELTWVQLFGEYREAHHKVDKIVRDPYYG